jgi:uncharacterized membrane protein
MKSKSRVGALLFAFFLLAVALQIGRAQEKCSLTYENFGKSFMQKYCVLCHDSHKSCFMRFGAPAGFDFDQPTGIQTRKNAIVRFAVTNTFMPPPWMTKPTPAERAQLWQWLSCEYGS